MSREEIYDKWMKVFWDGGSEEKVEDVHARAMDEYAKEVAIGFHKWVNINAYKVYKHDDTYFWRLYERDPSDESELNHDELYQLYLNQKEV